MKTRKMISKIGNASTEREKKQKGCLNDFDIFLASVATKYLNWVQRAKNICGLSFCRRRCSKLKIDKAFSATTVWNFDENLLRMSCGEIEMIAKMNVTWQNVWNLFNKEILHYAKLFYRDLRYTDKAQALGTNLKFHWHVTKLINRTKHEALCERYFELSTIAKSLKNCLTLSV